MTKLDKVMIKNMLEIPKEEREEYAEAFSEGNSELKDFLLFLWSNDINTFGCCAGHDDNQDTAPYISIDITNLNNIQLRNLINVLYLNTPTNVDSILTNLYEDKPQKKFSVYFDDNKAKFNYIKQLFSSVLKINKVVDESVLLKEDKKKLETILWLMNLDLEEYSKKLIIPTYNYFQIQNLAGDEFYLTTSICRELENIKSERELIRKIKNSTNEFDGYVFETECNEIVRVDEVKKGRARKILSAGKEVVITLVNNQELKDSLSFLEQSIDPKKEINKE